MTWDIGNRNLTLPSITLNPENSSNAMGLLKNSLGEPIFVFKILKNSSVFPNESADFHIMLPVPPGQNPTYYFFQDSTDNCGFPAGIGPYPVLAGNVTLINLTEEINMNIRIKTKENANVSFAITRADTFPHNFSDFDLINLGYFYNITAAQQTLNKLFVAEIALFYYDDSDITARSIKESSLKMYKWNEDFSRWVVIPFSGVDTYNNFIWAIVDNFSIFTGFGEYEEYVPPAPPTTTGGGGGGGGGGGMTIFCTEVWECNPWSSCFENETQTRNCTEMNLCETDEEKPVESKQCIYSAPILTEELLEHLSLKVDTMKKEVSKEEDVKALIELKNLGLFAVTDTINVSYSILDEDGNILAEGQKVVALETKTVFVAKLKLPKDTRPGSHPFQAIATYKGASWEADSPFEVVLMPFVEKPSPIPLAEKLLGTALTSIVLLCAAILALILILIPYAIHKKKASKKEEKEEKEKEEEIIIEPEKYFQLRDGTSLKSLSDLKEYIKTISEEDFNHYVTAETNHFATWIKDVFHREKLAKYLKYTRNKEGMLKILEKFLGK